MKESEVRYRRSPCVVATWISDRLVFENYATHKRVAAAPITCQVLDYFTEWKGTAELSHAFPRYSQKSLVSAVRELARVTLLQRSDRPGHAIEQRIDEWKLWNPVAGYFHFVTKDDIYDDTGWDAEAAYFRELDNRSPMPDSVKHYPGAPLLPMVTPSRDCEFTQVLLSRRTWRRFSVDPISYEDLSTLSGHYLPHSWLKSDFLWRRQA